MSITIISPILRCELNGTELIFIKNICEIINEDLAIVNKDRLNFQSNLRLYLNLPLFVLKLDENKYESIKLYTKSDC